ncbi:MAG: MiaB/RimO family radical SAM methylthiotransferase [Candidatus Cloacimonetes bacterium]|nr:MiaB/RimO family radical SAM methylthiotransferase [Candidatus Cloacimonadota bacterium]
MKTFYLESLGCAKNLVDSEQFAAILSNAGYQLTNDVIGADIVLINSCAFLMSALEELEDVIETVLELRIEGKIGMVIVSGCVMNRYAKDFKAIYSTVDHWIALKDFDALAAILNIANTQQRVPLEQGFHAYLRISDGCENYCSYCKIPSIRGKLNSIPVEELVAEAKLLAQRPVIDPAPKVLYPQELILIAQDSCLYGMDIYGRQALPELIAQLHAIEGFSWIRLMYLHPDHFLPEWIPLFKQYPKLLPYFEIPIQHSETHLLKAMNRQKGREELISMFDTIMQELPSAVLRTTLITGFPGETTKDENALKKFIERIPFLHIGTFAFSPEDGTPAYDFPDRPSPQTAENRQNRIETMWYLLQEERLQAYVDKKVSVLVEGAVEGKKGEYRGRAWFQAPEIDGEVIISAVSLKHGSIVDCIIDDVIGITLFASIVNEDKHD